ncbi:MAG: helix-turn-helix domain-containing protein [Alphaproteobacteria bacterium]
MPKGYKSRSSESGETRLFGPSPDLQREEFSRRLAVAMREKGWSQSELARRATAYMPAGQTLEKYSVNIYIKGKSFPEPIRLDAICKALGVKHEDLVPGSEGIGRSGIGGKSLEAIDAGDGMMWLIVHKRLPLPVVLQVLRLIHDAEQPSSNKKST